MNENEFAVLSAGYALNALTPEERRAFDEALMQHPEWSSHLRDDVDAVARLSDGTGTVTPPPGIRATLLARIADTPQLNDTTVQDVVPAVDASLAAAPSVGMSAPSKARTGGSRRMFVLAASVVLVAVLGFGTVTAVNQFTRPAAVVALEQISDAPDARSATVEVESGGVATAHWSNELGQAVLVSDDLPVLADDQTFEMWFVRDGAALPAGTFDASDSTSLMNGAFRAGDVIAVTVEPDGGSPTGQPTTSPIVAIPTV